MQYGKYGVATNKLVLLFQIQTGLSTSFKGEVENETADKLNELLKDFGAFEEVTETFLVKGTIKYENGNPCNDLLVKVYDVDVRRQELLGSVPTDSTGYYEINYIKEQFNNAERNQADLLVCVYNNDKLVQFSDIFYNVKKIQEINITVQLSEWEMIDAKLKPLLQNQASMQTATNVYRDLLPSELESADIEFLSKETGLDEHNIELWKMAYQSCASSNGVSPEYFYGWFRLGMKDDISELKSYSSDLLIENLQSVMASHIIPTFDINLPIIDLLQKF